LLKRRDGLDTVRPMELEVGRHDGDSWQALGVFQGPVSKAALRDWTQGLKPTAGTYQLREPGENEPRYLVQIGTRGEIETVEVLDID
jgi:hypothetical protein